MAARNHKLNDIHCQPISNEGGLYDFYASGIVRQFDLQPTDRLVDFGAGTAKISHLCWKKAGLLKDVIAVDPSKESLEIASKHDGITTRNMTSEEFIDTKELQSCNRFVFTRSFHHVCDKKAFLKIFHERALPGSKLMIFDQYDEILWGEANMQSFMSSDETKSDLQSIGFTVTKNVENCDHTVVKSEHFEGLRHRMYSILSDYTDEQIEKGIEKVDREHFQYKDSIDIIVKAIFLVATKSE